MLFYSVQIISLLSYDNYVYQFNEKMEKIYLASNYAVYYSSKTTYKSNPNWMDENTIQRLNSNSLEIASSFALHHLHFYLDKNSIEGNCIVRYIVLGKQKEIRKLYVCGD